MILRLRKVSFNDCELLFKWANDTDVRINSFSENTIEYSEHIKWLAEKLKNKNTYIFIMSDGNIPVGQVRIDIENKIADIDYSVDKNFRCKGYGKEIIKLLEEEIIKNTIDAHSLAATVKYTNISSQKVFEHNKFKKNEKKGLIEYIKEIKKE